MITVKHLSKTYNNNGTPLTVLRDVNCEINKGEVISIIGPSGTGKSTFLRCLNLLEIPTSGEIIIDGVNILNKKVDMSKVREKMGMVFQNFNLFDQLSILENVTVGPIKLLGMSKQDAEKKGIELLKIVGLAEKAHNRPSDLSGGQKQRVAIARCLSMDPDIILFDEPTSALDPTMVGEVLSVIRRLANQGMTMVIVTHEMKFARDVSTRIFYMDEGIIYEEGSPEVIFDKPTKPATTAFINKIRGININICSNDCDLPGIEVSIDQFCQKYSIRTEIIEKAKRVVTEMLTEVLTIDRETVLHVDYSEKKDRIYVSFFKAASCEAFLTEGPVLDKFNRHVLPMCATVHDDIKDNGRLLRLKIRNLKEL